MPKVKFSFDGYIELPCNSDEEVKKAQAKIIRGLFNKLSSMFEQDMKFYKQVHCSNNHIYEEKNDKTKGI